MPRYGKLIEQADRLAHDDKIDEAIQLYNEAIKSEPEQVSAYYNLALLYHAQNDLDGAISNFKKIAELDPSDASVFNNLGVLYYSKEMLEEAEKSLKKAIEIDLDYADALYGLGKVYQAQGKIEAAIASFNKCLRIEPNHKKADENLEKCLFKYRYPSVITIEIMDICNLKCRHCYLQTQSDSAVKGFMDYDFFEKIIGRISPLIKRAREVNFNSVEVLFHKRIFDMIDLVMKQNKYIRININTNGMLLDENRIDNLLKRKIYDFVISLDGCRKETVESFKTGVDFDRVISNMKKLKEKGGNKVNIVACFVAHKNNISELMDYIDFCKSLGVTSISISGFISYTPEMADYGLYSESGIKEVDEVYRKARQKAETIGIPLRHQGTKLEPRGCGSASRLMYIDKKGNIVPCVLFSKKTRMVLLDKVGTTEQIIWGNVLEEDPYKIWTSKASFDFRRLLHEKKLPRECALCAIGYKVIC